MVTDHRRVLEERTRLRITVQAFAAAAAGLGFIYLSTLQSIQAYPSLHGLLRDLGDLLVASVAIYLLWEFHGKKAFLEEIEGRLNLPGAAQARIIQVTNRFYTEIHWARYFEEVENLDIFVVYAETWRKELQGEFEDLARRKHAHVRVVLPDPTNKNAMTALSHRLHYPESDLIKKITDAYEYFDSLRNLETPNKAQIDIYFLSTAPLYSYYRFDDTTMLSIFSHRGRTVVPAIVCEKGGIIERFLAQEFEAVITSPLARKA